MKNTLSILFILCILFAAGTGSQAGLRHGQGDKSIFLPDIEVKTGVDYFYIDPGSFLPESESIEIESLPFYYFDAKLGWDFRVFSLGVKIKNTFHADSLKDDYLNQDDGLEESDGDRTRERILNMLGGITPFGDNAYRWGFYGQVEYRLFQTRVTVDDPTDYISGSTTTVLSTDEEYYINMYMKSYYFGLEFVDSYSSFAVGYYYNKTSTPLFVLGDSAIEDVTSENHSVFFNKKNLYNQWTFECEAEYGFTRFTNPDGDIIKVNFYYDAASTKTARADFFYRDNIKNGYYYYFGDYVYLGGYLGYSGYMPWDTTMSLNLGSAVLSQVYLWWQVISTNGIPLLQAPVNLLFNYGLMKLMDVDPFYADISIGLQAGVSF